MEIHSMKRHARTALLVIAVGLLAGAAYGAAIGQLAVALMFLALAVLCGTFEQLLRVWS